MTITPELPQLIDDAIETFARDRLHTAFVAQVVNVYDREGSQFVDVQPSVRTLLPVDDDRDDAGTTDPLTEEVMPVLPHVPVCYPQGGGFFISVPLIAKDFVLVVCCERSIDRWVEIGRKLQRQTISPGDIGTHTLEGAVCLPVGPAPRADLLTGVSPSDLVVAHVSGTPSLTLSADGTVAIKGDLVVSGAVTAGGEVTAAAETTPIALAAHVHGTSLGPTGLPQAP